MARYTDGYMLGPRKRSYEGLGQRLHFVGSCERGHRSLAVKQKD
jgi:hypothetical protein